MTRSAGASREHGAVRWGVRWGVRCAVRCGVRCGGLGEGVGLGGWLCVCERVCDGERRLVHAAQVG